jgi:hypothetical protein
VKSGRTKKKATRPSRASSSRSRKPSARNKTHASKRRSSGAPSRSKTSSRSKSSKKTAVSRARATTPARNTHARVVRAEPIPSPLPTKHVAPPRPVLVTPARSMPPARDQRKPAVAPARGPLVVPDFAEAGVMLAITYSIRDGRRGEFFDLMRELKPLLSGIGGNDCTVYEDRSRGNYFMEVFRFKDEAEFTAFDDKFHKDRKIAAIYALLDDIVEAEKSDFKIFERRL